MNGDDQDDLGNASLRDLFRSEAESQTRVLTEGLIALEQQEQTAAGIDVLMRAAHSLKGASRVVGMEPIERLAHLMEDCFIAVRKGQLQLSHAHIDLLLSAVDMISELAGLRDEESDDWLKQHGVRLSDLLVGLYEMADTGKVPPGSLPDAVPPVPPTLPDLQPSPPMETRPAPATPPAAPAPMRTSTSTSAPSQVSTSAPAPEPTPARKPAAPAARKPAPAPARQEAEAPALRIDARRLDRLLALAGEARVAAHALHPQLAALQRIRQRQHEALVVLDQVRAALLDGLQSRAVLADLDTLRQRLAPLERMLAERLVELDAQESRMQTLARELLDETLDLRMRPFREATTALPRMVRDLARDLGKEARLEIVGAGTPIDRDLLARIEAPLNQILRNAVDHGIEAPAQRVAAGKPAAGTIRIEAGHVGGMLSLTIQDDGRGLDPEQIRRTLLARGMSTEEMTAAMSEAELFEFLLLPGFSLREQATEISGRGVGMDVVADLVRHAHGSLRIDSQPGKSMRVTLSLPLARSLLRAVVIEAGGELLAVPLAGVLRVLKLATSDVHALAERRFFNFADQHVDLVPLAPLLGLGAAPEQTDMLAVVVVGSAVQRFGLVVDRIVGEHSLAVRPLPAALGTLPDVAGAALLEDGTPVLIIEHVDLLQSMERLAGEGTLQSLPARIGVQAVARRILVVDDSLTVREMERKLLRSRGYEVEVAVDGMDGWKAVRGGGFDLVITDVDMPRMDGIELVSLIKKDDRLRNLPVMIVSYKDRDEDRLRGMEAGADYYLTKGSFHDETLLDAVADLIGESAP